MKYFFLFLLVTINLYSQESSDPLTLNLAEALSRALNFNKQLYGAEDKITLSQFGLELAESEFNIQFTPNTRAGFVGGGHAGKGLSFGGGIDVGKKFESGTQISISPLILKTVYHYHTEVNVLITQPLLRGLGKDYQLANILGAKFSLRSAYRALHAARIQLILRTIQGLYEVVKAEKAVALHQESYDRINQFYQAAKLKEKIGLANALDIYRAEIELRHAEEGLTSMQEHLQEVSDGLRDLLALPLEQEIQVDVPLIHTPNPIQLKEAMQLAFENRIEMDQAEDQMLEQKRLARLAKKNLVPELNLVFNYSNCGQDEFFTRSCTWRRESKWGIGFASSTDFNALGDKQAYEQSLMSIAAAGREVDQTKTMLVLELKKTMRQLERSSQKIILQEEQIKTVMGELSLAKIKFNHGKADSFTVIQAEKTLRNAQLAHWSALIEHILGEFQLLASVGCLIDKPCIPVR